LSQGRIFGGQEIQVRTVKMKKQIDPSIKAHFVRSVLIVFSLVAVCVIPFALAQRTNGPRQVDPRYGSRTLSGVVNPSAVAGLVGGATPTTTPSCTPAINEGFDDITMLPGWVMINHSEPLGPLGWFQGNDAAFPAFDGEPTAYIAANFN